MRPSQLGTWLLLITGIVIAATIVAAIAVMGTPGVQRERRMDEARIRDLTEIHEAAVTMARANGRVPPTLETLLPDDRDAHVDPVTGSPYEYRVVGRARVELCATFARSSVDRDFDQASWRVDKAWRHPAGRHCFTKDVSSRQTHSAADLVEFPPN